MAFGDGRPISTAQLVLKTLQEIPCTNDGPRAEGFFTRIAPFIYIWVRLVRSGPNCPRKPVYDETCRIPRQGEITELLHRWEEGEPGAVEALAPLVYDQLRGIAEAYLRNERPEHTLQPTAVVNEVFVDLLRLRRLALNDRAHFFTFAAQLIRRILIDSARKAKTEKRGLGWQRMPLDAELAWLGGESAESLDLSAGAQRPGRIRRRSRPARSSCITSWAARWTKPRKFWKFPAARWNATCVFPWPGWASACARSEGVCLMRPAELERFRKVEEIFYAALEMPPGDDRDTLIRKAAAPMRACARSRRLARRIDERVRAAVPPAPERLPRFGAWQAVKLLGRGGMGTVYLAERADGAFQMSAAVKVVPLALASHAIEERFRRERQFLASLDHPKIARLIDGGVSETGLPYLVMEFVGGLTIDRFCDAHQLDTRAPHRADAPGSGSAGLRAWPPRDPSRREALQYPGGRCAVK